QALFPALAAVAGLVDAALGIGPEGVSLGSDVRDVGIGGMHPHARYLLRLGETERGPCLAAVGRLPDAVAVGHVAADRELAGADVHDVGIGLGDTDCADSTAEILVGHGLPGVAAVGALEDAAARGAEPVLIGARRRARDGDAAAAAEDADLAPAEPGADGRVIGLGRRGRRSRRATRGTCPRAP